MGRALVLLGMAAAGPSVWQTVTHITDDTYRTPEVRHGAGHVQYHMAREALVTAGAFGVIGNGVLAGGGQPGRPLDRPAWRAMAWAAGGFAAAMWSGGPVVGAWAPNRKALSVHIASTTLLAAGVALLRPSRPR